MPGPMGLPTSSPESNLYEQNAGGNGGYDAKAKIA